MIGTGRAVQRPEPGAAAGLHRVVGVPRAGRVRRVLSRQWEAKYPAIVELWESAWAEFAPFLRLDKESGTLICTTNAIKSLNARSANRDREVSIGELPGPARNCDWPSPRTARSAGSSS